MKPALSVRQAEIAALVAKGHPVKVIAHETGLSIKTVQEHIYQAASKIPGNATPRHRLTLWFFGITTD
jgi:DNA-binding NarL/FixJ family response regulator